MTSVKSYEMSGGSTQQNKNTTNWQLSIETAWMWGRLNYIYILLAAVLCNCFLSLWMLLFHFPFFLPTTSYLPPSPSVFSLFSPPAFLISILVCLFCFSTSSRFFSSPPSLHLFTFTLHVCFLFNITVSWWFSYLFRLINFQRFNRLKNMASIGTRIISPATTTAQAESMRGQCECNGYD